MSKEPTMNRTWMILHAVVAIGLPLFLALVASCIKAPEMKQPELGTQATNEEVERVISKALYGIDPWKTAVGQQIVYDFNARIENQEQVRPIARLTQTILKRDDSDPKKLELTIQSHELDANTGKVEKSEQKTNYEGGAQSMTMRNMSRPFETLNLDQWANNRWMTEVMKFFALTEMRGPSTKADREIKKVTYHNLYDESGTMDPPASVQSKPNCGGVPNCKMRYMLIDYDEATWYSDTEYEVQKWHFVISRDAPFLGYITERCLAALVAGADRRYFVRQCQFAKDFSFDSAVAPE